MLCCNDNLYRFGCLAPFGSDEIPWDATTLRQALEMSVTGDVDEALFTYGWAYRALWDNHDLRNQLMGQLHPSNGTFRSRAERAALIHLWEKATAKSGEALVMEAETARMAECNDTEDATLQALLDLEMSLMF